ncbi:MAG: hypothetical protein R3330_09670, partial [Saprospiraceae bacterium]|nr:hypothetical protein [Saprospiraceae bacterium]
MHGPLNTYLQICLLALFQMVAAGFQAQGNPEQIHLIPKRDHYFVESALATSASGPFAITRNILEDSKGDIWLATWHGVMRYHGNRFI